MILNMTGGWSQIQSIDFNLTADQSVQASGYTGDHTLEISNVFVPGGLVNGFVIMRNGNFATDTDYVVSHFYSDYMPIGAVEGPLFYVYYQNNKHYMGKNENQYAFYYRHNEKKLNVAAAMADSFMKAGNYRLLIW